MSGVDKLAGVKPGDRVRVTFEGRYIEARNDKCVFEVDGYGGEFTVMLASVEQPTFQIERIEPPLAVGMRVQHKTGCLGKILFIDQSDAFVRWDTGEALQASLENLVRA